MHFKLLLSLIALTSSAIAVTTGPYNVGSGHLTEVPSNIFAQQGQVNTVVNQTIGCDVAGPGLNLAGAPFQFQASSALPSRANDSSIYYFGRTEDRYQYWGTFGCHLFTGYRDSPVVNARGNATSTVQITGTPYTSVSLGRFTFDTNVNFSAGQLAAVPSRRFVFQRDQFTFSLSAAGKTANVTCSAGARRQNFGVANIASLPIWTQLARFAIVAVRNETLGTPPLNSTSLVSSYRPLCNFAGIGTQDFEISLGGFKSNLS
ncbi:unnamed protein product [Tilletia laevis]|uniref:Uncharacterized protein n=1 Tax=Tilletia laevis TaxID=157183 RepID=A0A9N8QN63_9BASI|nr:unnamed protein product [Tilletia laevis]